MLLSVVIPTLNEETSIRRCLESAQGLEPGWDGPVEVLVADGGSDDRTVELATLAGAAVLTTDPGRGHQLRTGVAATHGELVLMLHADAWIDPAAGAQLNLAMHDAAIACGAFRQRIDAPGRLYRWLEAGNAYRARKWGLPYGDQAIFARREWLDEIGGINALPLMEDVDLMQRLRKRTRPVLLDGPVQVSARRWQQHGVIRRTARNWATLTAYRMGVSPERLARWY